MRSGDAIFAPVRAVERFVFAPEDARRLAAVRFALFGVLALRLATNSDYAAVADQPAALFDPVSVFHLLPSMPSSTLTSAVQALAVLAAVLAAIGAWPRASFPTAFALALFLNLMLNATGKIVHNDVLVTLCLLPLLVSPTAACRVWSVRAWSRARGLAANSKAKLESVAYGWPIRTAMIIVGLAYLLAGVQKLRFSGLDWFAGDNLRYVLWASSDSQAEPNSLALLVADQGLLVNLLAAGALMIELGFILCLPFAKLRWLFVPGAVGLHLGIWLTMGLNYLPQAFAAVVVFVNWAVVSDTVRARLPDRSAPERNATLIAKEARPWGTADAGRDVDFR